jgi:hypothetical protein
MRMPRPWRAALCAALTAACTAFSGAHAAPLRYRFAVVANTMRSTADEIYVQRLIRAIGREPDTAFIVYDGGLRGSQESCRDALFERREALLQAARPALIFIPGEHDWVDCGTPQAGEFDPAERLYQLRQTVFSDSSSMGQNPVTLTRESEVSRFTQYRENVRWTLDDTVFIGLNVPAPNNHYLDAGGRNGEFDDRVIANAFWLDHAAEYARRRNARALVIFISADPDPQRYERPERFAWLRFARHRPRDGFLELKRDLIHVAAIFHGPVLLIHADDHRLAGGFKIDQPLRNNRGQVVWNLTRLAFAPPDRLDQWIEVDADMARRPPFHVRVRTVPRDLPLVPMAVQPVTPSGPMPASGYEVPDSLTPPPNPASNGSPDLPPDLPPLLPTPAPPDLPASQSDWPELPDQAPDQTPDQAASPSLPAPASTGAQPPASSVQRGP